MRKAAPQLDVRVWPDGMGRIEDIDYAAAWLPPPNVLKSLPNLKVIFSLGAGVDAILKDPTLPDGYPDRAGERARSHHADDRICRAACADASPPAAPHRREPEAERSGTPSQPMRPPTWRSASWGSASWARIRPSGCAISASRWRAGAAARKMIDGVHCYAGAAEFDSFLRRTDILVSLLPATPRPTASSIARRSANCRAKARSGHRSSSMPGAAASRSKRIFSHALEAGELHAATLDVFETEPLPADKPAVEPSET